MTDSLSPPTSTSASSFSDRANVRRMMRRQRHALLPEARRIAALNIQRQLCSSTMFQRAQRIALYLSNDNEVDPAWIAQTAWQQGKQLYLPVLHQQQSRPMAFARYHPHAPMRLNRFGIAEPVNGQVIPHWTLDLVLMPLVAFDAQGNRLGMGGGYYDRTFADLARRPRQPRLVGLAYRFQRVASLPAEAWDVPLSGIICG